jgi:integrase
MGELVNIAAQQEPPPGRNSRQPASEADLKPLWRALGDPQALERRLIARRLAIAVKLCALTLQRRGEVAGIDLSEIDLTARTWLIPEERTKNARPHLVPCRTTRLL